MSGDDPYEPPRWIDKTVSQNSLNSNYLVWKKIFLLLFIASAIAMPLFIASAPWFLIWAFIQIALNFFVFSAITLIYARLRSGHFPPFPKIPLCLFAA
ncbi:hypothetical protein N9A94_09500 [Akkermansiaceae bacterium]|nr:hypothetical protein [Akkermansiaceae bacterium]